MGLEGPGAAFESVVFAVDIQSSAAPEQVKKLIHHAERGCHAEQTLRNPIQVTTTATLNKKKLDLTFPSS
jgi:organic hydroperoxide reductase OsmC/OhrA